MSDPTRGDFRRLRRLRRYLVGRPRSVLSFEFQDFRGERAGHTPTVLGWLQEDSQEHERWSHLEGTTHPQDMVRHPERDPELRRSRASGNGHDES